MKNGFLLSNDNWQSSLEIQWILCENWLVLHDSDRKGNKRVVGHRWWFSALCAVVYYPLSGMTLPFDLKKMNPSHQRIQIENKIIPFR